MHALSVGFGSVNTGAQSAGRHDVVFGRSPPNSSAALRRNAHGGRDDPAPNRARDGVAFSFVPCLAVLLALISPRLALVAVWLLSDILSRAFDSLLLPFIGFFVLPWSTLAYAIMWDIGTHRVAGFEWFIVVLAFLADLGAYGGTARGRD